MHYLKYSDGLVQNCSNSSALAMDLLQSCTELSIYVVCTSRTRKQIQNHTCQNIQGLETSQANNTIFQESLYYTVLFQIIVKSAVLDQAPWWKKPIAGAGGCMVVQ